MSRALKDSSMQEQMGNVSRVMEVLRAPKILEIKKSHCNKNEEYLWWTYCWLDTVEERISEPEDIIIESSKTKKQG